MNRPLLIACVTLALSCVDQSNAGIPCEAYNDLQCPTGFWCKSANPTNTRWECASLDEDPAPQLAFVGLALRGEIAADDMPDSAFGNNVTIVDERSEMILRLRNDGGSRARLPFEIDIVESDCCMGADNVVRPGSGAHIEPGETFDVDDISIARPGRACPTDQSLTFTIVESSSGAISTQTFDVSLMVPDERNAQPTSCMGQPDG